MKLSIADVFDQRIVKSKDPFRIVITVNDKETTAAMMRSGIIVKKATARCNPDDRFSLKTGAELALSRLFEDHGEATVADYAWYAAEGVPGLLEESE